MATTNSFSEAEWYAEVFTRHEIASRVRAQQLNMPDSMRSSRLGTLVRPGEERYLEDPGHPAKDVIRAFDCKLLATVPRLSATIIAEKKRLAHRAIRNEHTVNEKALLDYFDKYDIAAVNAKMWLQQWVEAGTFWNRIVCELKQIFPCYFPLTNRENESDESRACALLAIIVSGVNPILDETDKKILRSLSKRRTPVMVIDLAADSKIRCSRRTLGPRLENLCALDLINRPKGERAGVMITPKGQEVLAELISKSSH
jgi:hypothetical protein